MTLSYYKQNEFAKRNTMLLNIKWFNIQLLTYLSVILLASSLPVFADITVAIPGLNKQDIAPDGCISCHKVTDENDGRLVNNKKMMSAEFHRKNEGFANMETIPGNDFQGCISCHEQSFGIMMHETHLGNPEKNKFLQKYFPTAEGCLACHKIEIVKDIGLDIKIKQGKVNWNNSDLKQAIKKEESWFSFN